MSVPIELERKQVGDLDMGYALMGEGPPLVMILGMTATVDWWPLEMLASIGEKYRLLVFDNRGAGTTPGTEGNFTVPQMAADTVGLMDALGFEKAHVLGWSMGGMIAQELALDYPDKVDKLVLCATYCSGRECVRPSKDVMKVLIDRTGTTEEMAGRFCRLMLSTDWLESHPDFVQEFINRFTIAPTTDENAVKQFMATVDFAACDRLPDLEAKTLVACGSDDVIIPADNSRLIAELIPDATLVEFEGGGHGFMYEMLPAFKDLLFDFLG